ncbi:MAG: hypothetical protein ABI671_05660 [Burkholderiales bacterium]
MIWTKTEAGRVEMQARAVVKERPQRNLLLVIDGIKTEEMLLANLAGISAKDFVELHSLGLITPVVASSRGAGSQQTRPAGAAAEHHAPAAAAAPAAPLDYAQFTATLTQMISKELGLRGFVLTLAVEKAGTAEELQSVATRTIDQIRERKGDAAAVAAQRALYGG